MDSIYATITSLKKLIEAYLIEKKGKGVEKNTDIDSSLTIHDHQVVVQALVREDHRLIDVEKGVKVDVSYFHGDNSPKIFLD